MCAHQGVEGRQKCAPCRARASMNQVTKLRYLQPEKRTAQQGCQYPPTISSEKAASVEDDHHDAARETRREKTRRLNENVPSFEELRAARPAVRVLGEHGISGKQGGKDDDVAEEEQPKAKRRNYSRGRRAALGQG